MTAKLIISKCIFQNSNIYIHSLFKYTKEASTQSCQPNFNYMYRKRLALKFVNKSLSWLQTKQTSFIQTQIKYICTLFKYIQNIAKMASTHICNCVSVHQLHTKQNSVKNNLEEFHTKDSQTLYKQAYA